MVLYRKASFFAEQDIRIYFALKPINFNKKGKFYVKNGLAKHKCQYGEA